MPKQRHIGFAIFGFCCALAARLALLEPKPAPQILSPAEERWGTQTDNSDPLHLIHGLRYYIYGLGVIGLLMVVEDYFSERSRRRKQPDKEKSDKTRPILHPNFPPTGGPAAPGSADKDKEAFECSLAAAFPNEPWLARALVEKFYADVHAHPGWSASRLAEPGEQVWHYGQVLVRYRILPGGRVEVLSVTKAA
jgi:hypothetical protein